MASADLAAKHPLAPRISPSLGCAEDASRVIETVTSACSNPLCRSAGHFQLAADRFAVVAEEWFRSRAWGPADQADFEARLRRAWKSSRSQYLIIKGAALNAAGHTEGARALWLRALADPDGSPVMRWGTLENLGDLDFDDDPAEAASRYRQLLEEDPTLNATSQMAEVKLAELLIRKGTPVALDEGWTLLEAWRTGRHSPFPANHFQWAVARARWGEAAGQPEVTRDSARQAVIFCEAGAPFARHPGVGVVKADKELLKWLRART